jgi:hypothetical protein
MATASACPVAAVAAGQNATPVTGVAHLAIRGSEAHVRPVRHVRLLPSLSFPVPGRWLLVSGKNHCRGTHGRSYVPVCSGPHLDSVNREPEPRRLSSPVILGGFPWLEIFRKNSQKDSISL